MKKEWVIEVSKIIDFGNFKFLHNGFIFYFTFGRQPHYGDGRWLSGKINNYLFLKIYFIKDMKIYLQSKYLTRT